ncbi:HAD family hydrolase [Candidatus Laterigemmans baculatus]|uniref:HAD family hydrolase n=1 Tax=Candidatus Laterigemmans baculatus TaxID=2770505 RepID=UPI0013DB0E16|nr:HAD family hydrolase [Candidatus Laterigemmans baculatus]
MKPNAVIFDLDGTLLDTLSDIAEASNRSLTEFGFPIHPLKDYRTLVGDGVFILFRRALPAAVADDSVVVDQCVVAFHRHYDQLWSATSRPYDGIPELLEELVDRGLRLGVLSNKPHEFTVECVRHFFPQIPFGAVFGHRADVPRKPDTTGVEEILRKLDSTAESCLYLGDTNTDMQTARNAKCTAVGVSWGFRSVEELIANGAEHLIDAPEQLLRLL